MARKKIDCGGARAHFCRERQFPPGRCSRGSFRTVRSGAARIILCRVSGKMRAQSILRPFTNPKCNVCKVR